MGNHNRGSLANAHTTLCLMLTYQMINCSRIYLDQIKNLSVSRIKPSQSVYAEEHITFAQSAIDCFANAVNFSNEMLSLSGSGAASVDKIDIAAAHVASTPGSVRQFSTAISGRASIQHLSSCWTALQVQTQHTGCHYT